MAAHLAVSPLQTPSLKPYLSFLPSPNPNAFSSSSLRSLLRRRKKSRISLDFACGRPPAPFCARCSGGHGEYDHEPVAYPRPQEIPWNKDIVNSVRLIGIVGAPVQIKHLSSGKAVAWTSLAVRKSASETTWVNLNLWDDLAHVAFQHVEKGHQVFVSGRLVSDVVEEEDEKRQVYYKVVVRQLNFIEKSPPAVSLYEPEARSVSSGTKLGSYVGNSSGSTEELWQAFFANPMDWWDNRNNKRNPKYPDFKHKHTGESMWVDAWSNPPWVKSQLAILDSRMGTLQTNDTSPAASSMYGDDFTPS